MARHFHQLLLKLLYFLCFVLQLVHLFHGPVALGLGLVVAKTFFLGLAQLLLHLIDIGVYVVGVELGEGVGLYAVHVDEGLEVALLVLVAHAGGEEPVDGALLTPTDQQALEDYKQELEELANQKPEEQE